MTTNDAINLFLGMFALGAVFGTVVGVLLLVGGGRKSTE